MNFETPKKIVFFGDSVTEGCFELYPASYGFDTVRRPEKAYPAIVTRALKEKYGENAVIFLAVCFLDRLPPEVVLRHFLEIVFHCVAFVAEQRVRPIGFLRMSPLLLECV